MAQPVLMPQVGQDIKTARIVDWLKKENQEVKEGEVIAVVESDKAAFDVEAYASGVLLKILYPEGEEVEVLTPIAYIGRPGEQVEDTEQSDAGCHGPTRLAVNLEPSSPSEEHSQRVPKRDRVRLGAHTSLAVAPGPSSHMAVSPSARRLAREKGIDLRTVQGTGPGGRITSADVLAVVRSRVGLAPPPSVSAGASVGQAGSPNAMPSAQSAAARRGVWEPDPPYPGDTVVAFSPMRARIAERLTRSKQTIPHFYLTVDVDMSEAMAWRRGFNETNGTRITVTDMIVKAAATALAEFPKLNSHVEPDRMVLKGAIHVGVAVAVEDGLIVPVVADADKKDLAGISAAARENAEAARAGRLKPQAIGSFTVTNLGMFAVDTFVPVINPPEAAILAVGAVGPRPAVVDGRIVARDMMTLVLACDHRAIDGAYAASFLARIRQQLENPTSFEG